MRGFNGCRKPSGAARCLRWQLEVQHLLVGMLSYGLRMLHVATRGQGCWCWWEALWLQQDSCTPICEHPLLL